MKGQLAQRPFGDVLSELYRLRATGILTVTRDRHTKAIFVEDGSPVFALGNSAEDQLGNMLVREGQITPEILSQFTSSNNAPQFAQELAASGFVSADEI